MLKRTLYFSSPCHLKTRHDQLIVLNKDSGEQQQTPIEDIGFVIFDSRECTFTQSVIQKLTENNTAVVFCDEKHHPSASLFPLDGSHIQTQQYRNQIAASEPLKKQLWQQTIKAKISNQAALLEMQGKNAEPLKRYVRHVKSGDSTNQEALASRCYWASLFAPMKFTRHRYGMPPNPMLNYGYMILRAAVARAIAASGLLPALGIHHKNKYNSYCLADDVMEPYRPFVDFIVREIVETGEFNVMTKAVKAKLLGVLVTDVQIGGNTSPLMVALSQTTASLAKCFAGNSKKIKYPSFSFTVIERPALPASQRGEPAGRPKIKQRQGGSARAKRERTPSP